tara:strand:+ start:844 stop:1308 length:465 start_codon:yes stop_codon:yes gene_type:complete
MGACFFILVHKAKKSLRVLLFKVNRCKRLGRIGCTKHSLERFLPAHVVQVGGLDRAPPRVRRLAPRLPHRRRNVLLDCLVQRVKRAVLEAQAAAVLDGELARQQLDRPLRDQALGALLVLFDLACGYRGALEAVPAKCFRVSSTILRNPTKINH